MLYAVRVQCIGKSRGSKISALSIRFVLLRAQRSRFSFWDFRLLSCQKQSARRSLENPPTQKNTWCLMWIAVKRGNRTDFHSFLNARPPPENQTPNHTKTLILLTAMQSFLAEWELFTQNYRITFRCHRRIWKRRDDYPAGMGHGCLS